MLSVTSEQYINLMPRVVVIEISSFGAFILPTMEFKDFASSNNAEVADKDELQT